MDAGSSRSSPSSQHFLRSRRSCHAVLVSDHALDHPFVGGCMTIQRLLCRPTAKQSLAYQGGFCGRRIRDVRAGISELLPPQPVKPKMWHYGTCKAYRPSMFNVERSADTRQLELHGGCSFHMPLPRMDQKALSVVEIGQIQPIVTPIVLFKSSIVIPLTQRVAAEYCGRHLDLLSFGIHGTWHTYEAHPWANNEWALAMQSSSTVS